MNSPAGNDRRPPSFELRATVAAPSAAWLLAQRAFAMPELPPAPQAQAVVVVRKGRGFGRPLDAVPTPGDDSVTAARLGAPVPSVKSPRVFRLAQPVVEADTARLQVGLASQAQVAQAQAEASQCEATAKPAATRFYRRHRLNAHMQPGPVRQVFQAPAVEPALAVETPRIEVGLSTQESAVLSQMMTRLNGSIQAIHDAHAFTVEPASLNWREFLDSIREMKSRLRHVQSL